MPQHFSSNMLLLISIVLSLTRLVISIPDAVLTSNPSLEDDLCPMAVEFTCTIQDVPNLRWFFNGSQVARYSHDEMNTFPKNVSSTVQGVWIRVTSAVPDPSNTDNIDATSVLTTDTTTLSERLLVQIIQCGSNFFRSENITIGPILGTPPAPNASTTECSLSSFSGGLNVSLQWLTTFNMDHAVERYHVTVTPDPSSCSSDQVSPSEDYSCSGLDLEGNYSITASPINCGNQEGESVNFNVHPQSLAPMSPQNIEVMVDSDNNGEILLFINWMESISISGMCSFSGGMNYTLILEDSTGMMMVVTRGSSDTCSNGSCSTTFSPSSQICSVSIVAKNGFGQSSMTSKNIGVPRLTSTNQVLLVLGAVLLCGAIAGDCIILVVHVMKGDRKDWWLSWILLLCGVVLIVVSVVLWVAVAFQVGLQDNTCDAAWQSSRDGLIVASFIFSLLSLVTMVVAAIPIVLVLTKSKSKKIANIRVEIQMEENKSELKPDEKAGGRLKALEKGEVLVEEFKKRGEDSTAGILRAAEEVFQQYSAAKQAESQYAVTQHNNPPVKVPPQTPTYSSLETHEAGGEGKKEDYNVLQPFLGKAAVAVRLDSKKAVMETKEEYDTLNTGEVQQPHQSPALPGTSGNAVGPKSPAGNAVGPKSPAGNAVGPKSPDLPGTSGNTVGPNSPALPVTSDNTVGPNSPALPVASGNTMVSSNSSCCCVSMWKYNKHLLHKKETPPPPPPDQVAAWFPEDRRWSKRPLKVYFVNKCPEKWKFNGQTISNDLILKLVNDTWKDCFTSAYAAWTSNIRVAFKETETENWSVLGSLADRIHTSESTLALNFSKMKSDEIKATIVHQFGHALGLGHALMEPDHWDVLKKYLNVDEMVRHYGSPSEDAFEVQWTGKGMRREEVNYDGGSVMRYRTNVLWLKEAEYSDPQSKKYSKLPVPVKSKFQLFYKHSSVQAKPSSRDLETLNIGPKPNEPQPSSGETENDHSAMTKAGLITLEDKATKMTFNLTDELAPVWKAIGQKLGLKKDLEVIKGFELDAVRLEMVWNKWFNYTEEELPAKKKYPTTWEGLHQLLDDSGNEKVAKEYFEFLSKLRLCHV